MSTRKRYNQRRLLGSGDHVNDLCTSIEKKMICEISDGESRPVIAAPGWVDQVSSLYTRGSTILFMAAKDR